MMKRISLSHLKWWIAVLLSIVTALSFTACSGAGSSGPAAATDVTFDFTTGDYSFSGVDGASEYRVRIFPVTDGVEEELPANESQPIRAGQDSYTGNVPIWSLTAGGTYNVYIMTTDEDGNTSLSEPVSGQYIATYDAITGGVTATITDNTITVSLGADALENSVDTGATYEIILYQGDTALETQNLESSAITTTTSGDGFFATTVYEGAEVEFSVDDPSAEYSVTVSVISNSDIYISSEESEAFAVTEPVEESAAEGIPGEDGDMPSDADVAGEAENQSSEESSSESDASF